jgi:hypothetical protein
MFNWFKKFKFFNEKSIESDPADFIFLMDGDEEVGRFERIFLHESYWALENGFVNRDVFANGIPSNKVFSVKGKSLGIKVGDIYSISLGSVFKEGRVLTFRLEGHTRFYS